MTANLDRLLKIGRARRRDSRAALRSARYRGRADLRRRVPGRRPAGSSVRAAAHRSRRRARRRRAAAVARRALPARPSARRMYGVLAAAAGWKARQFARDAAQHGGVGTRRHGLAEDRADGALRHAARESSCRSRSRGRSGVSRSPGARPAKPGRGRTPCASSSTPSRAWTCPSSYSAARNSRSARAESRASRPASVIALRAIVAACAVLPVCSSSSPSSSHSTALLGSRRSARSSEARAAGKLPAARCARLCSSNAPLAPLRRFAAALPARRLPRGGVAPCAAALRRRAAARVPAQGASRPGRRRERGLGSRVRDDGAEIVAQPPRRGPRYASSAPRAKCRTPRPHRPSPPSHERTRAPKPVSPLQPNARG